MTTRRIAARLVQAAVTVFLVATLTFIAVHLAPGDPLQILSESPRVAHRDVQLLRQRYHLDQPVTAQYVYYLGQLARGDWGYSFGQHRPVRDALLDALPATVELALAAFVVMFGLGVALGVYQGTHHDTLGDRALTTATLTLYAVPAFWLALLLMLLFVEQLHWLPATGVTDAVRPDGLGPRVLERLRHLALPAVTLGVVGAGYAARFQRSAVRDVLRQAFIRSAVARGLRGRTVLWRHALRNALLPTIALAGVELPGLLSGVVVIESIFGWPGLGRVAADAIFQRDYPLVTGAAILAAVLVVCGNLAADGLTWLADPRLRVTA